MDEDVGTLSSLPSLTEAVVEEKARYHQCIILFICSRRKLLGHRKEEIGSGFTQCLSEVSGSSYLTWDYRKYIPGLERWLRG